jgi:hypothetical protein
MRGITTIAALPNGAGQAAALPAEVGEKPAPLVSGTWITSDPVLAWQAHELGYTVTVTPGGFLKITGAQP